MNRKILKALTLIGCFSTGIIYGSIGVIAILSLFKLKNGGADEGSFFHLLEGFALGRVLNWVIITGAVCFIIWRFYEAIADPYKLGNDAKAILLRTGAAFSSGADAFIAVSVLQALFSQKVAPLNGDPMRQRSMVAHLLETDWGQVIVFATGAIVSVTALVLLFYGLSSRFTETIRSNDFSKGWKKVIHGIAYYGYFARSVILGITGFFYLKAAIMHNSSYVVNTDKAFDFIGDHIGVVLFFIIAMGTISYGLYMFILGLHYDVDAAKNK